MYNYNFSYVNNLININKSKKKLSFTLFFTKKILFTIKTLHYCNIINRYYLLKKNNQILINIFLRYYKSNPLFNDFKIFSKPSKKFFISYKSLRLLAKKTGSSVYLISTTQGYVTHKKAIQNQTGGYLIGFFSF